MICVFNYFFFQVLLVNGQQGKVVVEIDLKEFDSHGKDWNNDKCDNLPGGAKKCDPKFKFCVDHKDG